MNAFQLGICCFTFEDNKYVSRPFNIWAFPKSDILGNRTLQFKCSNLKFLRENKFDFNKLFNEGLNYQRLCNQSQVSATIKHHKFLYNKLDYPCQFEPWRNGGKLGVKSEKRYHEVMRIVKNFVFVHMAKRSADEQELLWLEMEVESFALRKRLNQQI